MRIAITGTSGRVGRALANRLASRNDVIELPRCELDLALPQSVDALEGLDFDVLLHPAAMTSLEACEDEPEKAARVNHEASARMARICRRKHRKMVYFSTDYVLSGRDQGLHAEDEPVDPRSVYAASKAAGEDSVLEEGGCVIRVSWVFGPERPAFPDQVVARCLASEPLAAVADKSSLPCFTTELAGWVEQVVAAGCPQGVFHACQSGQPTSWHGMAEVIVGYLHGIGRIPETRVEMQRLDEMQAFRAVRPRHTAMSTARLTDLLGEAPRPWEEALLKHVSTLISR